MKLSHRFPPVSAVFDDPNLVSAAGLIPVVKLAQNAGLTGLADQHLGVPGDKGAHAGDKVMSLVAGMVAGGDSIDDMALLRHGAMGRVFDRPYAPSTLGSFLCAFTFGHVRQLDAVASRFLTALGASTPVVTGIGQRVLVDIDDTIIEVHGYAKQGSGYGYSGVRGLNALLATATTNDAAPVIVAQRLRKGSAGSPRGAARLITDALATAAKLRPPATSGTAGRALLRADSAFYGHPSIAAALRARADVSVTVRLDPRIRAAIATIDPGAWTRIEYTDAIFDETTNTWISRAEVAEIPFTAFGSRRASEQVPGRLVVRRIPDLNTAVAAGQRTLFDTWRFHAFFNHHRPRPAGHSGRGQDPPRTRNHRTGPRRPEELRPGPPTIGEVHRQRGLACPGRHCVQPDSLRSERRRNITGQSDHSHHPPQTDHRPCPDRVLGQTAETAPTHRLALARLMDRAVHPDLRTTPNRDSLTTCRQRPNHGPQEHPDSEAGKSATPTNPAGHHISRPTTHEGPSVDRG